MDLSRSRVAVVSAVATVLVAGTVGIGVLGFASRQGTVERPAEVGASAPSGPGVVRSEVRTPGNAMGYVVYLPPGYQDNDLVYPTVVYLHGLGESGDGGGLDLGVLRTAGLVRLAATGALPATARGLVILAPQSRGPHVDVRQIHSWLTATLPEYRVDRSRLYLTGISMGGEGVFDYLAAYGDASGFAAMVPIAGHFLPLPVPDGLPDCRRMADTPLWAFHGAADEVMPVQGPIALVAYVNRVCHPPEQMRLTIYEDSFHNVWDRTYDLSGERNSPSSPDWSPYTTDIYVWLLRHRIAQRLQAAPDPDVRYLPEPTG